VTQTSEVLFELEHVYHRYGWNEALYDVNVTLSAGEVVAVVGDNGSGKSTLLKIIAGYHRPTRGVLRFKGQPIVLGSPGAARALGIEPVYQDLAILDDLNLWRNFFLGKERRRGLFGLGALAQGWMREECALHLHEIGLTRVTSVDRPARELSGGERQSLAVMRAVHFGTSMLLLDEPTASLSTRETSHVLAAIVQSRNRGLGILYIDHNVSHVLRIADRIVVLEHGRLIKQLKAAEVTENDVSSLLVSP
jgi:simple sugar transport system ATP-binding protein